MFVSATLGKVFFFQPTVGKVQRKLILCQNKKNFIYFIKLSNVQCQDLIKTRPPMHWSFRKQELWRRKDENRRNGSISRIFVPKKGEKEGNRRYVSISRVFARCSVPRDRFIIPFPLIGDSAASVTQRQNKDNAISSKGDLISLINTANLASVKINIGDVEQQKPRQNNIPWLLAFLLQRMVILDSVDSPALPGGRNPPIPSKMGKLIHLCFVNTPLGVWILSLKESEVSELL